MHEAVALRESEFIVSFPLTTNDFDVYEEQFSLGYNNTCSLVYV
jgi:hypothetical protein